MTEYTKKSTCHFLANWADRARICSIWNLIRKNPGTIGLIRPKVAFWIFRFFSRMLSRKNAKTMKMPLLGELNRSSRDSFESDSDSKESRDVRLNSPKSVILKISCFFEYRIDRIDRTDRSIDRSIESIDGRSVHRGCEAKSRDRLFYSAFH